MRALLLLSSCLSLLALSACSHGHRSKERHGLFDYDASLLPSGGSESDSEGRSGSLAEGGSCRPLSMNDRLRLLRMADPANFPATRYRRGSLRAIERETDCSHFVHEIYRRAGLRYGFRTTAALRDTPEFEVLPEEEAMPGDLMLFRGHVGLVDHDGRIISSTYRRRGRSSITRLRRTNFQAIRGHRFVLRWRCRPAEDSLRRLAEEPQLKRRASRSPGSTER